jgi:1-acyl-sn-glycerol-3-phosphate acyltransferase
LLVCNHLGYLDVLVLAALTPVVFVAKREVRTWPVFGRFARLAGTIFVDRQCRGRTGETVAEIAAALDAGLLVVLFPEGTSSSGNHVLPFKSALLAASTPSSHPVTPACLAYALPTGDVSEEVCYWRDMTLLPHLLRLLGHPKIAATVRFGTPVPAGTDRKALALELHAAVSRLHARDAQTAATGDHCGVPT